MLSGSEASDSNHTSALRWVRFQGIKELVCVGKDAVAFGKGCFIQFRNLIDGGEVIYNATNKKSGDGVECLAGHRTYGLFAFTEKSPLPRVFILSYPQFKCISILEDNEIRSEYQMLTFTGMEFMASIRAEPDRRLELWCWKTREKISILPNFSSCPTLKLIANLSSPIVLAHLDGNSAIVSLWDFHLCVKQCVNKKRSITVPSPGIVSDVCWSPDNSLFLIDSACNVFMVREYPVIVTLSIPVERKLTANGANPIITWFKGGVIFTIPDSKLVYCRRLALTSDESQWSVSWQTGTDRPITYLKASEGIKEIILAWTSQNELLQVIESNGKLVSIKSYGTSFMTFTFLKPDDEHIVILNSAHEISLRKTVNGAQVCQLKSKERINKILCNPSFPCIHLLCSSGKLSLVDSSSREKLHHLSVFYLCHEPLSLGAFNRTGDIFISVSTPSGHLFSIHGSPDQRMRVAGHSCLNNEVLDLRIHETNSDRSEIVVLLRNSLYKAPIGDEVQILDLLRLNKLQSFKMTNLCSRVADNPHDFSSVYAVPHRSRGLLKVPVDSHEKTDATSYESTGHQVRNFNIWSDGSHLLTHSRDGLNIIRFSENSLVNVAIAVLSHRCGMGVKHAEVDASAKYLVSLGHDGTFCCSEILVNCNHKTNGVPCKPSLKPSQSLENLTSPCYPEDFEEKSWLQVLEDKKMEEDSLAAAELKRKIMYNFNQLRTKLTQLLDENDSASDQEKLPIFEFNLDQEVTENILKKAAQERDEIRAEFEEKIKNWDQMKNLIVEKCWNSMSIKGKCLNAMGDSFSVENFPLPLPEPATSEKIQQFIERRKREVLDAKANCKPLAAVKKRKTENGLSAAPILLADTSHIFSHESVLKTSSKRSRDIRDGLFLFGSISRKFIEISPYHCSQLELTDFSLASDEFIFLKEVTIKLKTYFNKLFDEMFSLKEKEVEQVLSKHARLKTIQYERSAACKGSSSYEIPPDPVWSQKEKSYLIIQVEPHEISSKPYEPKSMACSLRKQKADEAKIRMEQTVKQFRENALMRMMDGVLEVRWEDLLKKDIPQPSFMSQKPAEEFTEEEVKEANEWKKSVQALNVDRERYRRQIDQDWVKITSSLQESIADFDKKLFSLYLLRLDVEAAIKQEFLIIVRTQLYHQHLRKLLEKEDNIRSDLANLDSEFVGLTETAKSMEETLLKYQQSYEQLVLKDKQLEKKFKQEFKQNTQKSQIEQLLKLYKRRLKLPQQSILTPSILTQLSESVNCPKSDTFLPPDCLDYLRALDQLDSYNNAPHPVDEVKWTYFCDLRKLKIKSELKIKAACVELAEAEVAVSAFSRNIKPTKEKIIQLSHSLDIISTERTQFQQNMQVQLVMKQGIIEVPISGKISDFEDAILIARNSLNNLNKTLHSSGAKKIEAIKKIISFNQSIQLQHWEYNRLTFRIEDLEHILKDLEKFKVTKEILIYLQKLQQGVDPLVKNMQDTEAKLFAMKEVFKKDTDSTSKEITQLDAKIMQVEKQNKKLTEKIASLSCDLVEKKQLRDFKFEEKLNHTTQKRLLLIMRRGNLISEIQQLHSEVEALQTQLEQLRMKTYPTLKTRPTA